MILKLEIGEICIEVTGPNETYLQELKDKYKNFVVSEKKKPFAKIILIHEILPASDEISLVKADSFYHLDGGEFAGDYCTQRREANIILKEEVSFFDSFLRVFYTILLLEFEGFLIHSAGLEKDGHGYLFMGPSESGKTTTARKAEDFNVLNDELTLLRKIDGEFYLFATPFNGEYEETIENNRAHLDRIFFLDKTLPTAFQFQDTMQTTIHFMENIFFFDSELQSNQMILDLVGEIAQRYEGFRINIMSEHNLWRMVDENTRNYSLS